MVCQDVSGLQAATEFAFNKLTNPPFQVVERPLYKFYHSLYNSH